MFVTPRTLQRRSFILMTLWKYRMCTYTCISESAISTHYMIRCTLVHSENVTYIITPRLRRGRVIGPVCVCVCVCLSVTQKIVKTLAKEPFRQKDGLKADIYATCRITFTFMSAVVLETAVSTIYSATSSYSLHVQYVVFFRIPCAIAAPVYYAVFFRVRCFALIMIALFPIPDPDPGSNLAHNIERSARGKCSTSSLYDRCVGVQRHRHGVHIPCTTVKTQK